MRLEHGNGADEELVQTQLILGFINASVKHHTCSTFAYLKGLMATQQLLQSSDLYNAVVEN